MDRKKRLRQQRRPPAQRTTSPTPGTPNLMTDGTPAWEQFIETWTKVQEQITEATRAFSMKLQLTKLDGRGDPTGKPIITSARNVIIDGKPFFEMTMKGTE